MWRDLPDSGVFYLRRTAAVHLARLTQTANAGMDKWEQKENDERQTDLGGESQDQGWRSMSSSCHNDNDRTFSKSISPCAPAFTQQNVFSKAPKENLLKFKVLHMVYYVWKKAFLEILLPLWYIYGASVLHLFFFFSFFSFLSQFQASRQKVLPIPLGWGQIWRLILVER